MTKKYFTYIIVFILLYGCLLPRAYADVCLSNQEAVDVVSLLDASERDLATLGSCEKLVKDLYKQLEDRDTKLVSVTQQLIEAKQDVIKYEASAKMWRKVAWYSTAAGIVTVALYLLPKVL
jgi:hypothetical protein